MTSNCIFRVGEQRTTSRSLWVRMSVALTVAAGLVAGQAATFNANFGTDPGGTALGVAEIEDGVLKLTDLADLPPADPPKPLPQNGAYILPDFNSGAVIQSFTATFKAAVGGGTALGAQGFSFVLANDLAADVAFREGGSTSDGPSASKGLIISFDTIDNLAGFNANGNDPGDAPGIIVRFGGAKVAARRFNGLQTYPSSSTAARYAAVEVKLDPDGTLDVTYDGVKVYDNVGIGYTPTSGVFGFGAGTGELTAAIRNNHWIDDVSITTTAVGTGSYVSSKSPAAQNVRPDASVSIVVQNLTTPTVQLTFDGASVTPSVTSQGNTRTIAYTPPRLLASGSTHKVELTYDTSKKFAFDFSVATYATIPASAKVAPATINTGSSGFKARVYQVASPAPGSTGAAEKQLAGLSGPNISSKTGANADGTFNLTTINFDADQAGVGQFTTDDPIPGYPGVGADGADAVDNIVIESISYLDLPAGLVTLGVTSDDGFKLTVGSDPRDVTAPVVGIFDGTRGASESVFSFAVQEAGIYGVRLLWFEAGSAANCELYSFDSSGKRILVNDRATTGHIKAYRDRTGAVGPFISNVKPAPNETGVNPKLSLDVVVTEETTTLNPATVKLVVKDSTLTPVITKSGKQTTISYRHPGHVPEGTYPVTLSFADGSGNSVTSSWSFSTTPGACENVSGPAATGYWTFDDSTLKAAIGSDITYIDTSIASHYSFGTSGQGEHAAVPAVNGQPMKFLVIPRNENGEDFRKTGIRVKPGLAASGGGKNANQWTLIVDLYWGQGHGFGTILRTHDLAQNNDGDLFWRGSDGSYGKGCCSNYDGINPANSHQRETWARVTFVADMTSTPKRFAKYVNGVKHREDVSGDGANIDGRFSLPAEIFMFNDGDDNEQSTALVSAIQFREGALTDEEVAALGGPSANGIPAPAKAQATGVAAQWEFNGSLQAKTGTTAQYIDASIASHYSFGTSGQGAFADVPAIGGQPAQFLAIPRNENGEDFRKTGLRVSTGLAPSGGGKNANKWTMIVDLYWGQGHGFGTILRTHDLSQNNDGDLFWRGSDGSYGKGCCSNYDGINAANSHQRETWARVTFVADMTSTPKRFAKYVNGVKHREDVSGDGANIDGRFSLPAEIYLFNDGDDNEQSTALVNSIQIRPEALTDDEVAALGGPSAGGIPEPQTVAADVKAHWTFDGNLNATVGSPIAYIDNAIASHYSFGTSGQGAFADVPGIGGKTARFLAIPRNENGEDFRKTGIRVKPGLAASGGGKNANKWTLIADLYWGQGHGFGTILRTHDLAQNNDGDLFWRGSDGSYGKGCCSNYDGINPANSHQRETWARVAFVADMTSTPKRFAKYVNGVKHREDVSGDGANIDGRFSLPAEIFMFNDGDDNEQSTALISALQFRDVALTDEEVAALGGPTADGPPLTGAGAATCVALSVPPAAAELHVADTVIGPYLVLASAAVNASAKTITVPTPTTAKFYRIRSSSAVKIRTVRVQGGNLIISYE
ncbi:MAG: hypothetical protein HY735_10680 [Verrucomicrobia bacterium]|nr:hypothetical protein [Verrucomicrobiota bacterium]